MEIKSENEQKSGYEVLAETEERVILFIAMSLLCYYCNLITDILLPVSASAPDIPG